MARARTCSNKGPTNWHESMSCRSETPSPSNASWKVLSQPWVNHTSTSVMGVISKTRMLVKSQDGCAHAKLHAFSAQYGGHAVFEISCTPGSRCDFTPRVQAEDCSKVSALIAVINATRGDENERHDLDTICRSSQALQIQAISGDYVHIIADSTSGPFDIDLCV